MYLKDSYLTLFFHIILVHLMKDYVKNHITVHKSIYELKIVDKIEVLNLQPFVMGQVRYSNLNPWIFVNGGDWCPHIIAYTVVFGMMQCCDLKLNCVPMKVPCSLAGSVMLKFKRINHIFHWTDKLLCQGYCFTVVPLQQWTNGLIKGVTSLDEGSLVVLYYHSAS